MTTRQRDILERLHKNLKVDLEMVEKALAPGATADDIQLALYVAQLFKILG